MTATTAPPQESTATGTARAPRRPVSATLTRVAQRQGALVMLMVIAVVMSTMYDTFATTGNLTQIANQAAFLAIIALGMTFVIFTGGIDLSVGSVYCLGGVLAAWGSQYGVVVAVLLALGVCGLIGLVQGLLIGRGRLPAFIVTLAGLLFARGLLLSLTDMGANTYKVPAGSPLLSLAQDKVLGLGLHCWLAILLCAVGAVVLRRTAYGSTLLAVGGQPDAATLMGLPVVRSTVIAYTVSGALSGLAGIAVASYTASGVTTLGTGLELQAISAVVIGGTLLAGGSGTVLGTLVGVLLLQVIANWINRIGLSNTNWQAVVSGAVLLVVATGQAVLNRSRRAG
jgi:ribose/xylose/arabinose/galactoside ABC-type transport system permease subunit